MLNLVLGMTLTLSPASAIVPPPNPEWNCEEPTRQQEMNWCAAQEFRAADEALNAQWRATSAIMKRRDSALLRYEPEGDGTPGYFETMLEAQRAWLTYRDQHCRVEGFVARGGSLEPLLVTTCKTALTEARTKELKELAQSPN
ncbi:MAG: lysozyme inhibitor LprI family protein [Pseudomonadota bacterium]